MYILVSPTRSERLRVRELDDAGTPTAIDVLMSTEQVQALAVDRAEAAVRWVWEDTARVYPLLLQGGIRVKRAHDLRLCHAILRLSEATSGSTLANTPGGRWSEPLAPPPEIGRASCRERVF